MVAGDLPRYPMRSVTYGGHLVSIVTISTDILTMWLATLSVYQHAHCGTVTLMSMVAGSMLS